MPGDAMRKKHQPGCPCCDAAPSEPCKDGCCEESVYTEKYDFNQTPWTLRASTYFDFAQGGDRNCFLRTQEATTARVGMYGDVNMSQGNWLRLWTVCVTAKMEDFRYLKFQQSGITGSPEMVADLQAGAIVSSNNTDDEGVYDLGDGWFAFWFTKTPTAADATGRLTVDLSHNSDGSDSAVTPGQGSHIGSAAACLGPLSGCDAAPDWMRWDMAGNISMPTGATWDCFGAPPPPGREICSFGGDQQYARFDFSGSDGQYTIPITAWVAGFRWSALDIIPVIDYTAGGGSNVCNTPAEILTQVTITIAEECAGLVGPGDVEILALWWWIDPGPGTTGDYRYLCHWRKTITLAAGQMLKDYGPIVMDIDADHLSGSIRGYFAPSYDWDEPCGLSSGPAPNRWPTLTLTPNG